MTMPDRSHAGNNQAEMQTLEEGSVHSPRLPALGSVHEAELWVHLHRVSV